MSEIKSPHWVRYPNVSFRYNIMLINGRALEVSDMRDNLLKDVVLESRDAINERIELIYADSIKSGMETARPVVLVARLALKGSEEKVLSDEGLVYMRSSNFHVNSSVLNGVYQPYWHEIAKTGYIPEIETGVHARIDSVWAGTWLGVRRPEQ